MSLALSSFSLCRSSRVFSASLDTGHPRATSPKIASVSPWFEETKGRIAKSFDKNEEISISTYDTAWVAMVPSPFSKAEPCFPDSLLWLLENQCPDGSWARPHHHSLLRKDVLSSTLASVLALKKWGLGQQHIDKGLHFLELNFGSATDENQITPMGFEIIFPAMLDQARALSMNLSLEQSTLNDVMNLRDLELKRINSSRDKEAYTAYIGEGLMGKMELKDIMKYQRKNGSLFNSPSTTAAAFTALPNNSNCLNYLNLVANKFGGAVPAFYPLDIYSQLCTIDNLEKLGISRYFVTEIRSTLDQIYRCWLLGDEEIFMDASTCALAFKILRMNGYHVTSDAVTKIIQEHFPTSVQRGLMTNVETTLELYRASELMLYPGEKELENQNLKLRSVLEHELSSGSIKSPRLNAEVKHALDFPFYAILERMATRKNIEHYNFDNTRMLKTSYCLSNFGRKDSFLLSIEDFNRCQAIHREEFKDFERWFVEQRLDQVDLAMNKFVYCYFTAAATFFAPELSDARMSWAKNAVMIAITDDLYDVKGSYEEKKKLIELLQVWDVDMSTVSCSKDVEIIFLALKSIVVELQEKGSNRQGRSLTSQGITVWLDCLNAYMQEVEWEKMKYVPTFDEYLNNAYVSFGLGPIIQIPIYLVGPKVSEEMVNHPEYHRLFKLMSTCGRLLNDIRGHDRESQEGKVSGVALYISQNGGEMSTEAAVSEIVSLIGSQRRELLALVSDNGSVFPKAIKELYWHMNTVDQLFYKKDDGFWSKELTQVAHHILQRPIVLEDYV